MATPAWGYLGLLQSLGQTINDAKHIVVLQVDKVNPEKKVIIFKKVADLKGTHPTPEIKHHVAGGDARESEAVLNWAEPGRIAIFFHNGAVGQTCIGHFWYECAAAKEAPWWTMTRGKLEQSYAYLGSAAKLRQHVVAILEGKEVLVTALNHHEVVGYRYVARKDLPHGLQYPVWRIKASLKIGGWPSKGLDGAGDAQDVPPLVKALRHPDPDRRAEAAHELGWIGPPAKAAIPALIQALKDSEGLLRVSVALALAQVDPDNQAALPALVQALKDKDGKVRKAAADALGEIGPAARVAVPALSQALKDADVRVRGSAARALGQIGPHSAVAVPALVEGLKDKTLRSAVVGALGAIGPAARKAVPALAAALKDADESFRWALLGSLARIGGPGANAAVPFLVKAMTNKRDTDLHCYQALTLLEFLGPEGKEAAPAVIAGIKSGRFQRGWVSTTLASIDPKAALPLLIADLKNTGVGGALQKYAAAYLGYSGPLAKEALPALAAAEKSNPGSDFARICAWARELIRGDYPQAVPLLLQGLKAQSGYSPRFCREALERLGPEAKEAIPILIKALQDKNAKVRGLAGSVLGRIGADAKAAVPALRLLLQDEDQTVRLAVTEALEKIQGKGGA
jgi:HEAT repeat protein